MERKKVCRYFERGKCKKEKCPFVHLSENKKVCDFHQRGLCKKGANCNFYHPPKETQLKKQQKKKYQPNLEKNEEQPKEQWFSEIGEIVVQGKKEEDDYHQQQKREQIEEGQEKEDLIMKEHNHEVFKMHQINMMLGFSSDEQSSEEELEEIVKEFENKKKDLKFHKTYYKKFPDFSKTPEFKEMIAKNEQKYFQGQKFIQILNKLENPTDKEFYQIIRKFQDSFRLEEEGNMKIYFINLRPVLYEPEMKLHFEMIEDYIELRIDSTSYPEERAKFYILNDSIPMQYRRVLTEWLIKSHEKKSIFDTLKIFMNNFEKIYEKGKQKLENEFYSQISLQQKIQKKIIREKNSKEDEPKRKRRQKRIKQNGQKLKNNPYVEIIKFDPSERINVGNMNYTIKINSLLLMNCQYVLAERVLLYLTCQCQAEIIHILEADRKQMKIGTKLKCKKCQITILLALQRQVMQIRSEVIGVLGIENARLIEVGGVGWKVGCSCDTEIIKEKICMPGQKLKVNCHECFKSMNINFMGLKFFNPYYKQGENIQDGKQLPKRGSCPHFKQSFRWIRYGCCGRTFSCDQCHSQHFQHSKIEGITMLCGFCSIQQPVSKECIHCGRGLVKGVDKGGHWEGGLGCRDQTLLSRKDAKKYSGLTKKKQK